jgi:hypothetical protein
MSNEQKHRGAHPADRESFGVDAVPALRLATADLSWLLSHGYARPSALKLVGDRYALTERQRLAVGRAACADASRERRARSQLTAEQMQDRNLVVDGFNLLVTLEAALSGGALLFCRDGCIRDMSSVHGSYHAVMETEGALMAVGARLVELGVRSAHWLLDSPVSNSGRLAQRIRELATERNWPWTVEAIFNPDAALIATPEVAVSSDSLVIDHVGAWFNLAADILIHNEPRNLWLVDLRD